METQQKLEKTIENMLFCDNEACKDRGDDIRCYTDACYSCENYLGKFERGLRNGKYKN